MISWEKHRALRDGCPIRDEALDLETASLLVDGGGSSSSGRLQHPRKSAGEGRRGPSGGVGRQPTPRGGDAACAGVGAEKEGGMPELTLMQCLVRTAAFSQHSFMH
jgi:hypothetical protein